MNNRQEKYKHAAITLANGICRDAIWLDGACNWIGVSNEDHYGMPKAYAKALGTNFYDGTSGIAFFLASLCKVHKDNILEKTARGALQQIIEEELRSKTANGQYGKLGFHTGLPGCIYVLQYAARMFSDKKYMLAAIDLVGQCMDIPQQHWSLDVIDGAAGAISPLLHFYNSHPDKKLKDFIIALGEHLFNKADNTIGMSWKTMPDNTHNLTGYAHGAAGFAHAMTELFVLTKNEKYLQAVRKTVAYENHHFSQQHQNWPDLRVFSQTYASRQPQNQVVCGLAWCHGAPGIGLSRLRAFEVSNDPAFKQDAWIALQTTLAGNTGASLGSYSMCHGLFGNAELLLYAARIFGQPSLAESARQLADECITNYIDTRLTIPNGLQTLTNTPDFMLGSSGMGYFFLRLYDEDNFPCMLLIRQ